MVNTLLAFTFIFGQLCSAQQIPNTSPVRPFAEHLRNSTVSIGLLKAEGFVAIGTGVLVGKKGALHTYIGLVTAKHVLAEVISFQRSTVRLRFAFETKPLSEDSGFELAIRTRTGKILWRSPIDGSDIALLDLGDQLAFQPSTELFRFTDVIGVQDLATSDEVFEGQSVIVFGFPSDVGTLMGKDTLVRAVLRAGIVAWIDGQSQDAPLVIDANILPGNSGGPVFSLPGGMDRFGNISVGGTIKLVGIVTDAVANRYVQSIGGLGRVEPAAKIRLLVDAAAPLN